MPVWVAGLAVIQACGQGQNSGYKMHLQAVPALSLTGPQLRSFLSCQQKIDPFPVLFSLSRPLHLCGHLLC